MISSADPIARARALAPLLLEHAEEAERRRRLHDDVVEALGRVGLFSLLTPPQRGGLRVALRDYLETIATLGEGCVSSAWVCSFYAVHSWMVCLFDEQAQSDALRAGLHRRALRPHPVRPRSRNSVGLRAAPSVSHVGVPRWVAASNET